MPVLSYECVATLFSYLIHRHMLPRGLSRVHLLECQGHRLEEGLIPPHGRHLLLVEPACHLLHLRDLVPHHPHLQVKSLPLCTRLFKSIFVFKPGGLLVPLEVLVAVGVHREVELGILDARDFGQLVPTDGLCLALLLQDGDVREEDLAGGVDEVLARGVRALRVQIGQGRGAGTRTLQYSQLVLSLQQGVRRVVLGELILVPRIHNSDLFFSLELAQPVLDLLVEDLTFKVLIIALRII